MLELDHVVVAVRDLDEAAARFEEDFGLTALPGGRHPGFGTANRIVPLGTSYVELMAIVDEDEPSAFASLVTRTFESGEGLGALCLRTDDIEAVATRIGTPVATSGRTRPDGVQLRWKLAGLEQTLAQGLPFFIQWDVGPGDHPGETAVTHRSGAGELLWVELGGDPDAIADRVGEHALDIRVTRGRSGVRAVGVGTPGGEIVIR
jgi:catechol 2,3-dioxygenase-like lactoylglutathione lyase family enzyme